MCTRKKAPEIFTAGAFGGLRLINLTFSPDLELFFIIHLSDAKRIFQYFSEIRADRLHFVPTLTFLFSYKLTPENYRQCQVNGGDTEHIQGVTGADLTGPFGFNRTDYPF